jgi:DNA-directed RNA polymerase subunit L
MFGNHQKQKNVHSFHIFDIDLSIVNSLRRVILADIENVAFHFDINNKEPHNSAIYVKTNNSPLHNEFLAQRISMIPIYLSNKQIEEWKNEDYTFEIDISNHTHQPLSITSNNIIVKNSSGELQESENMFPKNDITKEYIIITKLPPYENKDDVNENKLHVVMYASKGSASKSICWSTVSLCTFYNEIDENKNKIELDKYIIAHNTQLTANEAKIRYNTLEYQRAFKTNKYLEPNEFVFKIESECKLSFDIIFKNALHILNDKIKELIQFNPDKVTLEANTDDNFTMIIVEEDHTIGNLIQSLIYNEHIRTLKKKFISFIGYSVPHPLDKRVIVKMKTTKNTQMNEIEMRNLLIQSFVIISKTLNNIIEEWNNFTSDIKI